jgi:hypothetical protein
VTSGEQHRDQGLNEVDFEILAGLPASGPPAVAFPASNLGFSEGLVIRIRPKSTEAWTGNFQCGENDHTAVYIHPDGKRLIVVAGGSDYLVDPLMKELMGQTTDNISFSCEVPELEVIVFGDHIRFCRDMRHWKYSDWEVVLSNRREVARIQDGSSIWQCAGPDIRS